MLRFTLRDLFWLTLVVGLALGWWVDRGRLADRCEQLESDYRTLQENWSAVQERQEQAAERLVAQL